MANKQYINPLEVMQQKGITFRQTSKPEGTWYNFEECPLCKHKDYQCGLFQASSGGVSIKCWHVADNGFGRDSIRYLEFLQRLGVPHLEVVKNKPTARETPPNEQVLRRQIAKLMASTEAMAWLTKTRGYTAPTISKFRLGIKAPNPDEDGLGFLVFPLRNSDGTFSKKNGYYFIPGFSGKKGARSENGWCPAQSVRAYYNEAIGPKKHTIVVCEGFKDLWALDQLLAETPLRDNLVIVCGTHGINIPPEWKESAYWEGYKTIYIASHPDPAGDRMADNLVNYIGRECLRLIVPSEYGKDLNDYLVNGGTPRGLQVLLGQAKPYSPKITLTNDVESLPVGRHTIPNTAVDLNGAWVEGHLYYPFATILVEVDVDESGNKVRREAYETRILRSDKTIHKIIRSRVPIGCDPKAQVLRLSNGILIQREPRVSDFHNWDYDSALSFLEDKGEKPSLQLLYGELRQYFLSTVWLPHSEDYDILCLMAVLSYVQHIFDAVPYMCISGPYGSGKTATGSALVSVAYNGAALGQTTHAAMGRVIDSGRGLVYLDDIEAIGQRDKSGTFRVDPKYVELVAGMKSAYTKDSAWRTIVDSDSRKVLKLNLYGIKVVSNTTGAETILGSRMIFVPTMRMPKDVQDVFDTRRRLTKAQQRELVNSLHRWAFENCKDVEAVYKSFSRAHDRETQIYLPLQVIAELLGDAQAKTAVETSKAKQAAVKSGSISSDDIVKEAVDSLIQKGFYENIVLQHLLLEIKTIEEAGSGKSHAGQIPEHHQPIWVGKKIRELGLVDLGSEDNRVKRQGKQYRVFKVSKTYIKNFPGLPPAKDMWAFCEHPNTPCPYAAFDCPFQKPRTGGR